MSVAVFCHSPLSSRQPHHGFLLWLVCNTLCAALNIKIQKIALNNCWFNIMEPASTAEFEAAAVLWLNQRERMGLLLLLGRDSAAPPGERHWHHLQHGVKPRDVLLTITPATCSFHILCHRMRWNNRQAAMLISTTVPPWSPAAGAAVEGLGVVESSVNWHYFFCASDFILVWCSWSSLV